MFLGSAVVAVGLATLGAWFAMPAIVDENRLVEWLQVAVLLAGSACHAVRGERASPGGMLRFGVALLALSFAVREVDIDRLGTAPLWPLVEKIVRGGVGVLWLGWLACLVPQLRASWRSLGALARMPWLRATAGAGVFFVLSVPFDKSMVPWPADVSLLVEELLELEGAVMLLGAALARHGSRRLRSQAVAPRNGDAVLPAAHAAET